MWTRTRGTNGHERTHERTNERTNKHKHKPGGAGDGQTRTRGQAGGREGQRGRTMGLAEAQAGVLNEGQRERAGGGSLSFSLVFYFSFLACTLIH